MIHALYHPRTQRGCSYMEWSCALFAMLRFTLLRSTKPLTMVKEKKKKEKKAKKKKLTQQIKEDRMYFPEALLAYQYVYCQKLS